MFVAPSVHSRGLEQPLHRRQRLSLDCNVARFRSCGLQMPDPGEPTAWPLQHPIALGAPTEVNNDRLLNDTIDQEFPCNTR